jgi:hypothetical protein
MIKSLKHQITDLEEELKAQKILLVDLQEQLLLQKPILDVGVAIRRRYLEQAKQNFVDGQYVDARGTVNQQLIEAGHAAPHQASCREDSAIWKLGILGKEKDPVLASLYGVETSQRFRRPSRL